MDELDIGMTVPNFAGEFDAGYAYRVRKNVAKEIILSAVAPSQKRDGTYSISDAEIVGSELLIAAVATSSGSALIVSLSHDDYLTSCGGVQNVVSDEASAFASAGMDYLSVCPNVPLLALASNTDISKFELIVNLNGLRIGVMYFSAVIDVIRKLVKSRVQTFSIIHHFLGYAPEHVAELINSCGTATKVFVWAHDSFTICPSIHLLRNEMTFCGAPPASSAACSVCNSGGERGSHLDRLNIFFGTIRPTIVAPSSTMASFWLEKSKLQYSEITICPPADLLFDTAAPAIDDASPLRIAFLGPPAAHKGWHVFEALVRWFAHDPRYQFFHVGLGNTGLPGAQFYEVGVSRENRTAMVDALVLLDIHAVIHWSLCFETFSFTAHESWAAGAYLVARAGVGNISTLLNGPYAARGLEVSSDVELHAILHDGSLRKNVLSAPREYGHVSIGAGIAPKLMELVSHE